MRRYLAAGFFLFHQFIDRWLRQVVITKMIALYHFHIDTVKINQPPFKTSKNVRSRIAQTVKVNFLFGEVEKKLMNGILNLFELMATIKPGSNQQTVLAVVEERQSAKVRVI